MSTTHFTDGSALTVEGDGSRVLRYPDGRSVVITPEGNRIVRQLDGTAVMEEGPELTRLLYNLAQSCRRLLISGT